MLLCEHQNTPRIIFLPRVLVPIYSKPEPEILPTLGLQLVAGCNGAATCISIDIPSLHESDIRSTPPTSKTFQLGNFETLGSETIG